MGKWEEVKLYFISPIERNHHAAIEVHKKNVRDIRMGKDEKGYWLKYEIRDKKIEVNESQRHSMRHCIGLDNRKNPYRNYFTTVPHDKNWNDLVEKGLAIKSTKEPRNKCTLFWLSKQGVEFILGKSVSDKYYKEL